MANKKIERKKKHLSLTVLLVGKMIEINRKGLLVLVFTVIATLETVLAVTKITDSNFYSAIATCLGTNPVDGLCSSSEYGSMPDWDVSLVTDMKGWNGNIDEWDGTDDSASPIGFGGKTSFNAKLSNWDTSQVTSMELMFFNATAFNQDIGSWNTSQVTAMRSMFNSATSFNQDISSWNGTAATTAQSYMFYGATAFQAKYTCTNGYNGPVSSCVLQ